MPITSLIQTDKKSSPDSSQNLDALLSLKKTAKLDSKAVVTDLVIQTFEEIQKAQPGCCHRLEKSLIWGGTCMTALATPPALLALMAYQYGYDVISNPVSTLAAYGTFLVPAYVAQKGAEKVGLNPLSMLVGGVMLALGCCAKRAADGAVRGYDAKEEQAKLLSVDGHKRIVGYLQNTFQGTSKALLDRFAKHQNNPTEMYNLQQGLVELEANLPRFQQAFAEYNVSASETSDIVYPLVNAIKQVKSHPLNLRSGEGTDDATYNMKLLAVLPKAAASSMALTPESRNAIFAAQQNRLGFGHTLKTYAASLIGGASTAIVTPLAAAATMYFAHSPTFDKGQELLQGKFDMQSLSNGQNVGSVAALATTGILTLGLTAKVAQRVYNGYQNERIACDGAFKKNADAAKARLTVIYDGVADALDQRLESILGSLKNEGDRGAQGFNYLKDMEQLKKDAEQIRQKLPAIQKEIRAGNVIEKPEEVTKKLVEMLNHIKDAA